MSKNEIPTYLKSLKMAINVFDNKSNYFPPFLLTVIILSRYLMI